MDYIHLNHMDFYGFHGALPEETKLGQRFRVSLSVAIDLKAAGESDALEKTVNYAEIFDLCREIVEGEPKKLIEAVAERIAGDVLRNYPDKVKGCKVTVVKPDPPIKGHYESVAVEITRGDYV